MRFTYYLKMAVVGLIIMPTACQWFKKGKSEPSENASAELMHRKKIVQYAEEHIGRPYKYAGKSPATGFDCSGFTYFVLKHFDIGLSPASREQARAGQAVELSRVQPGDLIFFGKSHQQIDHVAMVVRRSAEGIICVHSTTSRGVIVENITQSSYWKPRMLFARDVITKQ